MGDYIEPIEMHSEPIEMYSIVVMIGGDYKDTIGFITEVTGTECNSGFSNYPVWSYEVTIPIPVERECSSIHETVYRKIIVKRKDFRVTGAYNSQDIVKRTNRVYLDDNAHITISFFSGGAPNAEKKKEVMQ